MRKNGGYATFQQLNQIVDFSTWKTKTPQASVRQIVQVNDEFFRIKPGLWALTEYKEDVLRRFDIVENNARSEEIFTHSYYQGIIVELGNMHNYKTYVPNQDKNKRFLEKKLCDITTEYIHFMANSIALRLLIILASELYIRRDYKTC